MRFVFLFSFLLNCQIGVAQQVQPTLFEQSGGTASPTYFQIIDWWKAMDAASPIVMMREAGETDAGLPLHLVLVSTDGDFNIASLKRKGKTILFINNGIHPGEPDGIDASMLLVRDIVQNQKTNDSLGKLPGPGNRRRASPMLPGNIVLAIIPVYNIGGALNRSKNFRVDQNGPVEKGFRGNAQNLDLNRDFIKCDSKEALSFSKIFHRLDPDVFVDNHVSNGADYQHVMTLLTTQHNKLGGVMAHFLNTTFEPALYKFMQAKGFEMVPYVNHSAETPDKGWIQFWDSPRYSSGYAALWNTFAFVPETHMLKPYTHRVQATKAFLQSIIAFIKLHHEEMKKVRLRAAQAQQMQDSFTIAWRHDRTKATPILLKGYEAVYKKSEVTGANRLFYDRTKPFEKVVPFYNTYADSIRVKKPVAYLIPQGWWRVIERLQANNIRMQRLKQDTIIEVEAYRIESYQSYPTPYEGHHLNHSVQVSKTVKKVAFRKGDYLIPFNQRASRFLMETLEPQAADSYFAWNFFDAVLQQKEGFSDYVFEETAQTFLNTHAGARQQLEARRKSDTAFANNPAAQLDFIYKLSPYYEPAHLQYPVYRLVR
jgi:hypothetical protein